VSRKELAKVQEIKKKWQSFVWQTTWNMWRRNFIVSAWH